MRKQIIEYSLDYELPKDAVDDIFQILKKENAENINLDFLDTKIEKIKELNNNFKNYNYKKAIEDVLRIFKMLVLSRLRRLKDILMIGLFLFLNKNKLGVK